jgi:hypothetical protein
VHLDADMVARRVAGRRMAQRLAVAEADFEDARRAAAEGGVEIARRAGVLEAESRPQRVEGTLLGLGEAALAQHEAAHLALACGGGERLGRRFRALAGIGIGQGVGSRGCARQAPLSPLAGRRDALQRESVMIS